MSRTKNGFLWTDFETKKILELSRDYKHQEIAAKVGRTKIAISKQISKSREFLKAIEERKKFIESIN